MILGITISLSEHTLGLKVMSFQGEVEWQAVDTQRPWMSSLALKSQSDSFRPVHLTQLLGFLAGVKGAGSWDPGGHLPNHFLRIIASCQASSAATAGLAFRQNPLTDRLVWLSFLGTRIPNETVA